MTLRNRVLILVAAVAALAVVAVASDSVPEELRSSGLALVQTGQAAARFVCSLGFGAAWTLWGDRTALMASAVALAVCAAFALTLRPGRPVLEPSR